MAVAGSVDGGSVANASEGEDILGGGSDVNYESGLPVQQVDNVGLTAETESNDKGNDVATAETNPNHDRGNGEVTADMEPNGDGESVAALPSAGVGAYCTLPPDDLEKAFAAARQGDLACLSQLCEVKCIG